MTSTTQPKTDRSYGIIPLRLLSTGPPTPSTTQLLLINQKCSKPTYHTFWCFPKGHAEPADTGSRGTAIRELEEETGLKVAEEDLLVFRDEKGEEVEFREVYSIPARNTEKEVRFWVGVVRGAQEVRVQEIEVKEARWVGWEEAEGLLTYEEGKAMLRRVKACLGR